MRRIELKSNSSNLLESQNIKELEYEKEVYDNNYIKFYIIEKIKYKIVNKGDISNYVEKTNFLINDEIDKYKIDIDKEKYIIQIEDISYGFKFNDQKPYDYFYKKCNFIYSDDYHLIVEFDVRETKGNYSYSNLDKIHIEYFRAYMNLKENCIYDVCGMDNETYYKLKQRARDMAKNYVDMVVHDDLSAYEAKDYYNEFEEHFNTIFKSIFDKVMSNQPKVKDDFNKVKKLETK